MSKLAQDLIDDAKAYRSGGKKKIQQNKQMRKQNTPLNTSNLLNEKDYKTKAKLDELTKLFK